jgi:hypothetical protein
MIVMDHAFLQLRTYVLHLEQMNRVGSKSCSMSLLENL